MAADPVLELTVGDETYVGRAVVHNDDVCWLAHADGRLSEVSLQSVSNYRQVGKRFQGLSSLEARNELREELGREWEIVGTGHYLVAARKGRARDYAEHFENLYRSFRGYFSRRDFRLPQPEFPLIAVVFASQQDFVKQCRLDQVPPVPGLKGYYKRTTNRIALFEEGEQFVMSNPLPSTFPVTGAALTNQLTRQLGLSLTDSPSFAFPKSLWERTGAKLRFSSRNTSSHVAQSRALQQCVPKQSLGTRGMSPHEWNFVNANIQGSLKDTIVHEATHQVAYNLGLHSRIGQSPRWTVEGLATMFEAEGTRKNTGGKQARGRVNEERLWWFGLYRKERREPGSLADFVASEDAFRRNPLDFYAEAWALTFFLAETRPREYAEYLKAIAKRDPLQEYTGRERVADFQAAFGNDLSRIEVEMLRFFDNLQ